MVLMLLSCSWTFSQNGKGLIDFLGLISWWTTVSWMVLCQTLWLNSYAYLGTQQYEAPSCCFFFFSFFAMDFSWIVEWSISLSYFLHSLLWVSLYCRKFNIHEIRIIIRGLDFPVIGRKRPKFPDNNLTFCLEFQWMNILKSSTWLYCGLR